MRSSKDRTIEKKRRQQAMGAKRTEASRARRTSNKHKRQEIHAIDPSLKVLIMNQKIYDIHGTEIEVMDGKIRAAKLDDEIVKATIDFCKEPVDYDDAVVEYQEVMDDEAVIEKIEIRNKSAFRRLTDKLRRS